MHKLKLQHHSIKLYRTGIWKGTLYEGNGCTGYFFIYINCDQMFFLIVIVSFSFLLSTSLFYSNNQFGESDDAWLIDTEIIIRGCLPGERHRKDREFYPMRVVTLICKRLLVGIGYGPL